MAAYHCRMDHLNAFMQARAALAEADVDRKLDMTGRIAALSIAPEDAVAACDLIDQPGRPARPRLVPPQQVGRRRVGSRQGHAALIHALAHIEFNAINLALDCVCRFRGHPVDFYRDWLRVAAEEGLHFRLLRDHLRTLGFDYGDFDAHDGLWQMAVRTAHDPLARMALVPRLLEARGLDATPGIMDKLGGIGDTAGVAILEIVLRDEIGHVAIGNRWFGWLCQTRDLDPLQTQADLAQRYRAPRLHGPFNLEARRKAGFSERELALLQPTPGSRPKPPAPTT